VGIPSRDRQFDFVVFVSFFQAVADHPPPSSTIATMSQSVAAASVLADDVDRRFDAAIAKRKAVFADIFKTEPEAGKAEIEDFAVWGREFKGAWVSRRSLKR
jgi:hypothetical protein